MEGDIQPARQSPRVSANHKGMWDTTYVSVLYVKQAKQLTEPQTHNHGEKSAWVGWTKSHYLLKVRSCELG